MRNLKNSVKKRIDYLDLLRVVAIVGVISFHYLFSAISRGRTPQLSASPLFEWARYGYLGVELFFMISGFVILQSVRDLNLVQFIKRRFLRLYPIYWISLIFIYVIATFGIWHRQGPFAEVFYYNLTMFPTAFNQPWLDAAHWFMARQLQFYIAIAIIILFRGGKQLPNIFIWWSIIGCLWNLLDFNEFNIWYFNGFFALIAGGAIINVIRENGFDQIRVVGLLASYVWAMKSRIDNVYWLDTNRGPGHSALAIGIIVSVIYLLMMLTWNSNISKLSIRYIGFAGTLSYPVYLIHDRLGGLAIARFATESNKYFIYITVVLTAVFLAYLIWHIEKRVMAKFSKSENQSLVTS